MECIHLMAFRVIDFMKMRRNIQPFINVWVYVSKIQIILFSIVVIQFNSWLNKGLLFSALNGKICLSVQGHASI